MANCWTYQLSQKSQTDNIWGWLQHSINDSQLTQTAATTVGLTPCLRMPQFESLTSVIHLFTTVSVCNCLQLCPTVYKRLQVSSTIVSKYLWLPTSVFNCLQLFTTASTVCNYLQLPTVYKYLQVSSPVPFVVWSSPGLYSQHWNLWVCGARLRTHERAEAP